MMKSFGILLFCLLFVAEGERYVVWSGDRKLSWEDFSGTADDHSTFTAYTKSKITMGWECDGDIFKFTATAKFDTESSWKKENLSDRLLAHEQLHFDLAELYARKMRQHFSKVEDGCALSSDEVKEQTGKIQSEWEQREKLYDRETEHSKNKVEQARWETMVTKELQALAKYAVD